MNERSNQNPLDDCEALIAELCAYSQEFHRRGWSLGTSSNYSAVVRRNPLELIVTASGKDKSRLEANDFVRIGPDGSPTRSNQPKSSAETQLHVGLARHDGIGAVLHTHSVWSTLLSERFALDGGFELHGFEMLKGLSGVVSHEHHEWIPVFENTQDIPALARKVDAYLAECSSACHAYLIRRHGLYTWGSDLSEARRHIEILEFLFECVGREMQLGR